MSLKSALKYILFIILFPILLVLYLIFLFIWIIFTLTGIGPFFQYLYKKKDNKLLDRNELINKMDDFKIIHIPKGLHSASINDSYSVAVRFTIPKGDNIKKNPICIPNGLGATIVTISILHEELVKEGYIVLSYDRLGVGFSDNNTTNIIPTAEDVINEMNYIMNYLLPNETNWILIGPSMGSIVAQCYMATYPEKVKGFVNVDGLPYPFSKVKDSFVKASYIYKLYTYLIWTGLFRPFIGPFLRNDSMKWLSSNSFPIEYAIAQMNQKEFYGNLALEMITMMNLCEFMLPKWDKYNILKISENNLNTICQIQPFESIEIDETLKNNNNNGIIERKIIEFRSESEIGSNWISKELLKNILIEMENNSQNLIQNHEQDIKIHDDDNDNLINSNQSPLQNALLSNDNLNSTSTNNNLNKFVKFWKDTLIVRVLSARNHDYGNFLINKFYTQDMKNLSSAEHTLHAYLSKNGTRRVYPYLNHMKMFAQIHEITLCVNEINEILNFHNPTENFEENKI